MVFEATLHEKQKYAIELLSTEKRIERLFREGEILNKRSGEFEPIHISDVEAIAKRIAKISKRLRDEHDEEVRERETKNEVIKELLESAAERGITIEDLAECGIVPSIVKKPRPIQEKASFLYKTEAGQVIHVIRNASGSGRLSNEMKDFLERENKVVTELIFTEDQVKKALELNLMPYEFEDAEESNNVPDYITDLENRIENADDESDD